MFDQQVHELKEVIWNGEDRVKFEFKDGMNWEGSKRKDFWHPDKDWESIIVPGSHFRVYTVQWSIVVGFEIFLDGNWESVWCAVNNFPTKAERKKSEDEYIGFIKSEGSKIAGLIDAGHSLSEIDDAIDDGHSGNTYAHALAIGIQDAKNRERAEAIRVAHNKKYGVRDDKNKGGVVNPAVVNVEI